MSAFGNVLRKDLRRIWPQVSLWFAAALLCYTAGLHISTRAGLDFNPNLYWFLYWVSWISIFPSVVQVDATSGTREFWMTRPISWRSLLAAKMVAALVVGPVLALVVHGIFLATQGFTAPEISRAFTGFAPFLLFVMTMSFFLAALTPTALRFWFVVTALAIGFLISMVIWAGGIAFSTQPWSFTVVLAMISSEGAALVLLAWHYRTRATRQTVLAATLMGVVALTLVVLFRLNFSPSEVHTIEEGETLVLKSPPTPYIGFEADQKYLGLKISGASLPAAPLSFQGAMIHELDQRSGPIQSAVVTGTHIRSYLREFIGPEYHQLDVDPGGEALWLQSTSNARLFSGHLAGKMFGHRLRFECLARLPIREGERLARGALRMEVVGTPFGSEQRQLIVKYQFPDFKTQKWDRFVLVLVNSARKEWRVLEREGARSERFFGVPSLTLGATGWSFTGGEDNSSWGIALTKDWLKEAMLWVFEETPDAAVTVPFTCVLSVGFWSNASSSDSPGSLASMQASGAPQL